MSVLSQTLSLENPYSTLLAFTPLGSLTEIFTTSLFTKLVDNPSLMVNTGPEVNISKLVK